MLLSPSAAHLQVRPIVSRSPVGPGPQPHSPLSDHDPDGELRGADAASSALLAHGKARGRALMGATYDNITAAVVYVTAAE